MRKPLAALSFAVLTVSGFATADDLHQTMERRTLTGRPVVAVEVVNLDAPELASAGVTVNQIKTDVELRLRKNGVPVGDHVVGGPFLEVDVTAVVPRDEQVQVSAVSIRLSYLQPVTIVRTTEETLATTWQTGGTALLGRRKLSAIRNYLSDYVDQFANDYLAANSTRSK
jgi:hypothetical protein